MLSRFMTRREQLVLCFVSAAIVLGSGVLVWIQSSASTETNPETLIQNTQSAPSVSNPTVMPREVVQDASDQFVVSIQGAVVGAGVYEFSADQRVNDAIEAAGGLLSIGDTGGINLAAKLVDGTTLYIPKKPSSTALEQDDLMEGLEKNHPGYLLGGGSGIAGAGHAGASSGLIDLNTASQAQLESLPGIGSAYAKAIIDYRTQSPFQRIEDVQDVHGIGPKRFDSMRELVTVQ